MEKLTNFKRKKVYFEKQSNDRLCGVHCLNSLLQAPFFDPFLLAEIANRLDQLEMELYFSFFLKKKKFLIFKKNSCNPQGSI